MLCKFFFFLQMIKIIILVGSDFKDRASSKKNNNLEYKWFDCGGLVWKNQRPDVGDAC